MVGDANASVTRSFDSLPNPIHRLRRHHTVQNVFGCTHKTSVAGKPTRPPSEVKRQNIALDLDGVCCVDSRFARRAPTPCPPVPTASLPKMVKFSRRSDSTISNSSNTRRMDDSTTKYAKSTCTVENSVSECFGYELSLIKDKI